MTNETQAAGKMDAVRILKILSRWKKQLIIVAIGAAVVSSIFTMPAIMTPMFKSTSVVYPVNIEPYSNESPTEQLVQIFKSDDIRDSLIKSFNLYKHYDIDINGQYPRFKIMKKLDENITIEKNEFESVDISVYDADPVIAKEMCDSMIYFMNLKERNIRSRTASELAGAYKMQMSVLKVEMDSMENAIQVLRSQYGILDFENQIEGFSREYYRSLSSGHVNGDMQQMRKNLEDKGGEYVTLREHLWRTRGAYNDSKNQYYTAMLNVNKKVSYFSVITPAAIPEKKDSPKRLLIVLGFTLSCLFFACVVILYQENFKSELTRSLQN